MDIALSVTRDATLAASNETGHRRLLSSLGARGRVIPAMRNRNKNSVINKVISRAGETKKTPPTQIHRASLATSTCSLPRLLDKRFLNQIPNPFFVDMMQIRPPFVRCNQSNTWAAEKPTRWNLTRFLACATEPGVTGSWATPLR